MIKPDKLETLQSSPKWNSNIDPQGAVWELFLSGHWKGGAGSLSKWADTSTPSPRCFVKCRLWQEVKALDGGQRSSWGCMCSYSWLPEVKEGKLEICVVCERDIAHWLEVCVTPKTQMNSNAGYHQRSVLFSYLVCIWGYKAEHICTIFEADKLKSRPLSTQVWNHGSVSPFSSFHLVISQWLYWSTWLTLTKTELWVSISIKCHTSVMLKHACEMIQYSLIYLFVCPLPSQRNNL